MFIVFKLSISKLEFEGMLFTTNVFLFQVIAKLQS